MGITCSPLPQNNGNLPLPFLLIMTCCTEWKNAGQQQYLTRKDGRYQKCRDRQTDIRQGEKIGQMDRWTDGQSYTHKRRSRTKNLLSFGFPSYTKPTGVICMRELVIHSDNGFHLRDEGYTPERSDHGRHHISSVGGGSVGGGWRQIFSRRGVRKVRKGEQWKDLA